MRPNLSVVLCLLITNSILNAEEKHSDTPLVEISSSVKEAWLGQKVSFTVNLRATGPFTGAAGFSIPNLPRILIMQVGNPVVSSEEKDGTTWIIQSHEFLLFSQVSGNVSVPEFEVRYSNKDGYTGPEESHVERVPSWTIQIKEPPGFQQGTFLVTTSKIEIEEIWDKSAVSAQQGDIVRRTILQKADELSGMALAPPPQSVPNGVRMYPGRPEVNDHVERGDFAGSRKDVLTYVLEGSGTIRLPAIKYIWWNPDKEEFGSKTLPEVEFQVAPKVVATDKIEEKQQSSSLLLWLLSIILAIGFIAWQRDFVTMKIKTIQQCWNPPQKVARRELLTACRENNPKAALRAWQNWVAMQSVQRPCSTQLEEAIGELNHHLYGNAKASRWDGKKLETSFNDYLNSKRQSRAKNTAALPPLNP